MKTSSKMLFMSTLVMSTILVISSSSWMSMWIGLEINLMSFIPLMSEPKNSSLSQSSAMYFLTQSMSSMLFLMIILSNKYMFTFMSANMCSMMISMSMMMKMGMPPFHFWFPEISNKLKWNMCLLLMTWQKMAPMYVLSMTMKMNDMMITMICLSAMMGSIGGLNQTSIRKMMAYSSMNHLSWMSACAMTFKKSWMMYLLMYTLMMISISWTMYTYNIMYINQMNMFFMKNTDKMNIIIMMMSMGGLPPFLGFLPKWMTIQYMIQTKEMIMMIIMVISALITLSYYLRISLSMNMMSSYSQKWMILMNTKKSLSTIMFSINMLIPMMILMLNFY